MPFDLITALFVGCFAGGFTWILFRARRRRPPPFLIPVVIGGGILGYTVWNEYSWANRTIDALPADIVIIEKLPYRAFWQPWTLIVPRVNRLIGIDAANLRRNEALPGAVLVDVLLFERMMPTRRVVQVIDCIGGRRADVTSDEAFLAGAPPAADAWAVLRRDNPLYLAVCGR